MVDSDPSVRESLELLVRSAGWQAEAFGSGQEFLARPRPVVPSCLILDVALPDLNGLELQERIASERPDMPIIFLTGNADIATIVRAMKRGALEYLSKPFDAETLLIGIQRAIKRSEAALARENQLNALRTDYGSLTQREREVMTLVVSGLLNKQVGGELGISEITVKAQSWQRHAKDEGELVRKPDQHGSAASHHALNRDKPRVELTHAIIGQRVYTISVANPAGPPPTRLAPGKPEQGPLAQRPRQTGVPALSVPNFYITGRQPLRPAAVLLAIVAAVLALSLVLYALSHGGHAYSQKDDDDPDQIDTIVLGDPESAPVPAPPGITLAPFTPPFSFVFLAPVAS